MKYSYKAVNTKGKTLKGEITATNEVEALAKLREEKLVPVKLKVIPIVLGADGQEAKNVFQREIFEKEIHDQKFPRKKLISLYNQFAVMLKAGVTLSMAVEVMMENEDNARVRRLLRSIHEDLMNGLSLSMAMSSYATFDAISFNLVRAGEADGQLERSFSQMAEVLEKQNALAAKVKSAAIYPCILLVMVFALVILLNTVILPSFIEMFKSIGKGLPAITQFVINMSDFINNFWYVIIIAVAVIILTYTLLRKNVLAFAIAVDKLKLRIPLIGKLILHSQTARFSRVLSTLLEAGQDFVSALSISQAVLDNKYMISGLESVSDEICMGVPVSAAMAKQPFFAPVFISMVRAGEESGSISDTLHKMADMYDDETGEATKQLTTMMEPMMTVLIAIVVGVVVIAVAVPMFSMFDMVGNI